MCARRTFQENINLIRYGIMELFITSNKENKLKLKVILVDYNLGWGNICNGWKV